MIASPMNFSTVPPCVSKHGLHAIEVAFHGAAEGLGIEALTEFGRPGHVAEEDRDRLASLASRDGLGETGTALRAELRPEACSRSHSWDRPDTAGV